MFAETYSIDTPVERTTRVFSFFFSTCLIVTSFVIGYRYQRSGAGGTGVYTFSGDFAASQRQASNIDYMENA